MTVASCPRGVIARRPTVEDVENVTGLLQACDLANFGFKRMTSQALLRNWSLPDVDLSQDAWLVVAPDNQLVAYADLMRWSLPHLYATPRVHPDYESTDLYGYLLGCIEERACQLIAQAPAGARVVLNTFGVEMNQLFLRAIEQAGFVYARSSWRMQIDMADPPPEPEWPGGIVLRPFTLDMARAVHAADEEAFADHWGHLPASFEVFDQWLLQGPAFDPTLWFIPVEGEQIVGCALCESRNDLGWVGSLSTRRPWRRRGLALAMLQHVFGEFYRRGTRRVGLDVDAQSLTGATRLYEKAGMRVIYQENQYQKQLREGVELSTQVLSE